MVLEDNYCTAKEAAEELGVTRQTIHRWINQGILKAEKIGNTKLIEKAEIAKYKQARIKEMYYESFNWHQARNNFNGIREFLGYSNEDKIEIFGDPNNLEYLVTKKNGRKEIISINSISVSFNSKTGHFQTHLDPKNVIINDYDEYITSENSE